MGDSAYSFSLTTFDTNGKLEQVERAMKAASMGTPILAIIKDNDTFTKLWIYRKRDHFISNLQDKEPSKKLDSIRNRQIYYCEGYHSLV